MADRRDGFAQVWKHRNNTKSQILRKTGVVKVSLAKIRPRFDDRHKELKQKTSELPSGLVVKGLNYISLEGLGFRV